LSEQHFAAKTTCKTRRLICAALVLLAVFLARPAGASADSSNPSKPQAKIVAHLPLSGDRATRIFLRQQGKTRYLYIQRVSQQGFTVIDVELVARVPLETRTVMGSGLLVTETPNKSSLATPLHTTQKADNGHEYSVDPESIHVLDVSDSAHPLTVGTFTGVTSVLTDDVRGLIYVANGDGIWILSHRDPLRGHECSSSDATSPIPNCD
jgi:hypothetical protein